VTAAPFCCSPQGSTISAEVSPKESGPRSGDRTRPKAEHQHWFHLCTGCEHRSRGFFRASTAQSNLSQLSERNGGEFYALGLGAPVTLKPYFDEIGAHLNNQYLLTFNGSGGRKDDSYASTWSPSFQRSNSWRLRRLFCRQRSKVTDSRSEETKGAGHPVRASISKLAGKGGFFRSENCLVVGTRQRCRSRGFADDSSGFILCREIVQSRFSRPAFTPSITMFTA